MGKAALRGCGVTTGFGSAVHTGETHPGVASSIAEASELVTELTRGEMANVCVVTTDTAEGAYVAEALSLGRKRGRVVITAIGHPTDTSVAMSLLELTLFEKQVRGSIFGSSNPRSDIFKLLSLYDNGQLKRDELITREYVLDDVNTGYDDMLSGRNLRGLIRY